MNRFGGFSGAILFALTVPCFAGDQITVYSAPKDRPPVQVAQNQASPTTMQAQMAAGASDIPVNSAPIHWTTPAGWEEKPADGIRKGSFAIKGSTGGHAELAITSFPGQMGTELDNVNRWRRELGLSPVGPDEVKSTPVTVDGLTGKLYNLGNDSARTIVVFVMQEESSWFLKLRGDAPTVASATPAFMEFLKSVHFGSAASAPIMSATSAPTMSATSTPTMSTTSAPGTMASDPHAGLNMSGLPAAHPDTAADDSSDTPQWNIPADWKPAPPRAMIFKNFMITGDGDARAEVTISFFEGEVGGLLANVNRWRGQIGQSPIDQGQLDGVTEPVSTAEGKATLVDFTGTDAKTGGPARMVALVVPHAGYTWFYKLMGNSKLVGSQKDSFVQFVKTVHYR